MASDEWICQNCRFWITADAPSGVGRCRRNPPSPYIAGLVNPDADLSKNLEGAAIWPKTRAIDWCGEFLAAKIEIGGRIE